MARRLEDARVRARAFGFLAEETARHGDVLPWAVLVKGFELDGERVPLVSQQGIFKPGVLELPLTIRTTPPKPDKPAPYADAMDRDGFLIYSYRGTDVDHRENVGLRTVMRERLPLAYLFGVSEGQYMPVWPAFVVEDRLTERQFRIAIDDQAAATIVGPAPVAGVAEDIRRRYVTRITYARVHQRSFRERVLRAYQERCAVCHFKHRELLDAAHIVPDRDPLGEPHVRNGLALCNFHHAAFDAQFLGIRPDYVIEIRADILEEQDGPMLKHGLQQIAGRRILLPHATALKPDPKLLELRYAIFKKSA